MFDTITRNLEEKNLGMDEEITLKWVCNKLDMREWIWFMLLGHGAVVDFCEKGNMPSCSMKVANFCDKVSH
jgi:hypothetical protein